jgi:hypothetical protein
VAGIGDNALDAGYQLVPDDGPEGRVKYGAREINRTRDYIAQVKVSVPSGKPAFRTAAGISYGTTDPSGGADGDIYFKIVT